MNFLSKDIGYQDSTGADWRQWGEFVTPWTLDTSSRNYAFAVFSLDEATVPEPASLALVGLALAGIGMSRRKRIQPSGAAA